MPKATFLFWNLAKKKLFLPVENMLSHFNANVMVMAEVAFKYEELLGRAAMQGFEPVSTPTSKVHLFTNLGAENFSVLANESRYTVWHFDKEGYEELLIVGLHMPSKMNLSNEQQSMEAAGLNLMLTQIEQELGMERTVVMGDFNMNPFDYGMVSHAGFNAVMSRKIAKKKNRTFQTRSYPYFYNPMWGFLGDLFSEVHGTFYRLGDYNWHIFDQVLIRSDVFKNFDPKELQIVVSDGTNSLLNKSGNLDSKYSDHLPIKFTLNL
ncbi:MAG: hypothetical protein IT258_21600 [Saprospiraceae bacterium]|nr:hypothetical protein [Saprospiraceae bacterium]